MQFKPLPKTHNSNGKQRTTGFEFELTGMGVEECAKLVAVQFDGQMSFIHSLEVKIQNTSVGDFKVELDTQTLKKLVAKLENKQPHKKSGLVDFDQINSDLSKWIGEVAGIIVPVEIVTPPLLFEQFPQIEMLRQQLQENQAEGTKVAITNAFGMHINPEVASTTVEYIRDVVRAFLILYPWLKEVMDVDLSRRVLTYIDPFPDAYIKLVLAETYKPDLSGFIDDYLVHNPTRNRALDLLPLFAHLMPEKLKVLGENSIKLVKARPTFHYRLPNCEIDDPNWRIARDWNYWVEVETLAENKKRLHAMAAQYLDYLNHPLRLLQPNWADQITKELGNAA